MIPILVIGAGKIGSLICTLLAHSKGYYVYSADIQPDNQNIQHLKQLDNFRYVTLDANQPETITHFIKENPVNAIISSLPFYCNTPIAIIAGENHLHYFDLTEDVATTQVVYDIAKTSDRAFVPQCGLAPGFISIVANDLMQHFPQLKSVKLRVGALPTNVSNALQYSLTWSTDGLINEYGNPCQAIVDGLEVSLLPLENLEEIQIDGLTYEAFNTSGGVGSLVNSYLGQVDDLNYKTIRYPGHCKKIRFLMNDLDLNHDRKTLKRILEHNLPKTLQDVVLVYVSVTGIQNGSVIEKSYVKKFYPKNQFGLNWSAIQLTTACGISAIADIVLNQPNKYKGFVKQEQFTLQELTENRFGQYYA
jgi:saccharopine dehydrogenase-like NADP-dependent oxidoreductase